MWHHIFRKKLKFIIGWHSRWETGGQRELIIRPHIVLTIEVGRLYTPCLHIRLKYHCVHRLDQSRNGNPLGLGRFSPLSLVIDTCTPPLLCSCQPGRAEQAGQVWNRRPAGQLRHLSFSLTHIFCLSSSLWISLAKKIVMRVYVPRFFVSSQ